MARALQACPRSVWFGFLALLALLPFQFALSPAPDVDLAVGRVLILALLAFWIFVGLARRRLTVPRGGHVFFLTVFFVVALFSISWALNPAWSLRKYIVLLNFLPFYLICADCLRSCPSRIWQLLRLIGVTSIAVALIGVGQFLAQFIVGLQRVEQLWRQFIAPIFYGQATSELVLSNPSWFANIAGQTIMRAIAFFPDPHVFSFWMGLSLPIIIGLFLKTKKTFWIAGAAVVASALLFSFVRGSYLGLTVSMLVMATFLPKRFNTIRLRMLVGSGIILILAVLTVFSPVRVRSLSTFQFSEGAVAGRLAIWSQSWRVLKEYHLVGIGLGNYPLAVSPGVNYRSSITAHNTFLDVWIETGILGLIAWTGIWLGAWLAALRKTKQARSFDQRLIGWLLLGSFSYFLTHSFFETIIYSHQLMPLSLTLLALLSGWSYRERSLA